ncbi:MAG: AlpA family phage regulatory protein [Cycloclasticus sp.]|jgi:Predicted transcriptional regulator
MSQVPVKNEVCDFWRLNRVLKKIPLSKATIYRLISRGEFPKPVKLTSRTSAWDSGDVLDWLESKRNGIMEGQI